MLIPPQTHCFLGVPCKSVGQRVVDHLGISKLANDFSAVVTLCVRLVLCTIQKGGSHFENPLDLLFAREEEYHSQGVPEKS